MILFGVRFLRKGLDRLFGGRLVIWIGRMSRWRLSAFGSGILAGVAVPSSTAQALITVQLMNAGHVTFERMLAVLLGANVGITIMVQLLAFHVQDSAGVFILAGVIGFQFLQREVFRGIGQSLLALGFLFLSMQLIGSGAAPLASSEEAAAWMRLLSGHPMTACILAVFLTVLVQSSTASIGFAIALAGAGLFAPTLSVPWIVGTNIGIGVTTLAAGWSTLDGRRLGVANLLSRLLIAGACLLPASGVFLERLTFGGSIERDLAMLHTAFNLAVAVVFLPFLGPFSRAVSWLVFPNDSVSKTGLPIEESHLDPQALESPVLALANASREVFRMSDSVRAMLDHFWRGYANRDLELIGRIQSEDDAVDRLYRSIKDYLSRLGEGVSQEDAHLQFGLLTFSNELESIGDIIDKNLCDILRKQTGEAVWLPEPEYLLLTDLHQRLLSRFRQAEAVISSRMPAAAKDFLEGKEALNRWCREAEREHYSRLRGGDSAAIAASAFFLDLLDNFRRINSHLTAVAYAFRPPRARRRVRTQSVATGLSEPSPDPEG